MTRIARHIGRQSESTASSEMPSSASASMRVTPSGARLARNAACQERIDFAPTVVGSSPAVMDRPCLEKRCTLASERY